MGAGERSERFPWLAASAGASLVVLGAAALFRFPAAPEPADVPEPRVLRLTQLKPGDDEAALQELLGLQDPTPLFLPTRWNSGQADLRAALRPGPSVRFGSFPPQLAFTEEAPALELAPWPPVPLGPLEAVQTVAGMPPVSHLARRDLTEPPLPQRLVHFQVVSAQDGRVAVAASVTAPELEHPQLRDEFWSPVELLVAVDPGGMVGRPTLIETSGSESVDAWVLDFLRQRAHLGARLAPGFYRVLVGP
jgi:hypothetical protein